MGGETIFQLFLATILGALIGLEREWKKKEAGIQTYSLVTLGACLFTVLVFSFSLNNPLIKVDISRVIQAVAVGMGFIGAGTIIFYQDKIKGLTTAAGLWTSSGIGISIGAKYYLLGIVSTGIVLLIFTVFGVLERKIVKSE